MLDRDIVALYWKRSQEAIAETQKKYGKYCLSIAKNILPISVDPSNQTGAVIFWIFIIGLPLLFSRWIKWRHTPINMILYWAFWWIVDAVVGLHQGHYFLAKASSFFYYIDRFYKPWYTMVCFWLIQSAVFAAVNLFRWYRRRSRLRNSVL